MLCSGASESTRRGSTTWSDVLVAERGRLPGELSAELDMLTRASRQLRRDRELAFYGADGLTPSGFYSREDGERAGRAPAARSSWSRPISPASRSPACAGAPSPTPSRRIAAFTIRVAASGCGILRTQPSTAVHHGRAGAHLAPPAVELDPSRTIGGRARLPVRVVCLLRPPEGARP